MAILLHVSSTQYDGPSSLVHTLNTERGGTERGRGRVREGEGGGRKGEIEKWNKDTRKNEGE